MRKKSISVNDRLKLIGLLALAAENNKERRAIERAAANIVGEPREVGNYYGVVSDEVSEDAPDADRLLEQLGITVSKGGKS